MKMVKYLFIIFLFYSSFSLAEDCWVKDGDKYQLVSNNSSCLEHPEIPHNVTYMYLTNEGFFMMDLIFIEFSDLSGKELASVPDKLFKGLSGLQNM